MAHFPSDKANDDKEKEKIDAATKRLCVYPGPLVESYNAVHEKKYVKLEDRVAITASNIHYEWVGPVNVIDMAAILFVFPGSSDGDDSATQPEQVEG